MKKLMLLLFLVTSPCNGAEPVATGTVAKIEQMMPTLTPEAQRRAQAILNMAKEPELERAWQQVNNPEQTNALRPKPPAKGALQRLEHFTKLLQECCTMTVAVSQLGVSAQELYNFLAQGTPPQGGTAPMPMNGPTYGMPPQSIQSSVPSRPFYPSHQWQPMHHHPMNGE